jgi:arylsulfatase A-like enzyme
MESSSDKPRSHAACHPDLLPVASPPSETTSSSRSSTRPFGGLLAWLSLVVALIGIPAQPLAGAEPPNLIFLLTDDQRWDTLGAYGNPVIHTPHLDRLAHEGVTFHYAFVTTAICMTSRASILAGQYAARHRVWRFDTQLTSAQLAATYPGLLQEAGYRTGFIGKWGVGRPPEDFFDYARAFPGQGNYFVEIDGERRHLTSVMGDQAIEFLAGARPDQPFCLSISFKAPHVDDGVVSVHGQPFPYDPALAQLYTDIPIPVPELAAPRYFEQLPAFLQDSEARARWAVRFWGPTRYQFSVKSYYRLISGVDVVVGRIRDQLQALGFSENTVIVFTSDNGFYLGEYGLAGKWFPHELSMRVPLLVFDPRLPAAQRGTRRHELALNIDLAPTLLDLAGLDPPDAMQGRSLLPLLRDEEVPWRDDFFYEHLFQHPRLPPSEGVRTAEWKYMVYVDTHPRHEELYHLERDPGEIRNLATEPAYTNVLADMRARWQRLREEAR